MRTDMARRIAMPVRKVNNFFMRFVWLMGFECFFGFNVDAKVHPSYLNRNKTV